MGLFDFQVVLINLLYAAIGGTGAILFMYLGFKVLDHVTRFDTNEHLAKGNTAVGVVVAGMFVGIGVAVGLVIGLGLN
jgi:uncharacterized membrane protein YjfL (UPF0719 family)